LLCTFQAVYAFLPSKCQDTYRELFQSIVDNCHASNLQLNVQTIITDFEDAVLRAVTAVFGRQKGKTIHHTTEQSEVVVVVVERHQTKLLYLSP
jgi:2-hydroxy-3-keto-5-methylthiopentenyl-1-phosphate phosphatase